MLSRNTCLSCQERGCIWKIFHFSIKRKITEKSSYIVSGTHCYSKSVEEESTDT